MKYKAAIDADTDTPPRPGSPAAQAKGCTCAAKDNHLGKGVGGNGEKYGWWISGGCPLHAPEQFPPK